MRIIGGKYRGRVLKEFAGKDVRPTSDRARESLFNILQRKIPGCTFLDLFTGTGGVGIEALSRGAEEVCFVDASKESVALCKANLALVKETATVLHADFLEALRRFSASGKVFDVVFLDPPYALSAGKEALSYLNGSNLLAPDAVVVYEHAAAEALTFSNLEHYDRRKYGVAQFDFYRPISGGQDEMG